MQSADVGKVGDACHSLQHLTDKLHSEAEGRSRGARRCWPCTHPELLNGLALVQEVQDEAEGQERGFHLQQSLIFDGIIFGSATPINGAIFSFFHSFQNRLPPPLGPTDPERRLELVALGLALVLNGNDGLSAGNK